MKLYIIIFSICLLYTSSFYAQNVTISGYVSDSSSGEKLLNAVIYNAETFEGTTTNEYGFYSLTLPKDTITLILSFVGYAPSISHFDLTNDTIISAKLTQSTTLKDVIVSATKQGESLQNSTQMSTIEIPIEQIKALPAFLGEVDVLKALQLLPGVQGGTEGTSGLFVRGGSPDQNLILLDGVPVYNASHLFGFFSVFNSDAINKVTLIKGGFPARYGGRLSSVIDIRMKEGNANEIKGEGSIGLVASRFTIEGPIKKDKSSFIISARRTYIDLIARPIIKAESNGDEIFGYYFYDLNAKINYRFSDKDRLYLSGYLGRDKFYYFDQYQFLTDVNRRDEGGLEWGNATAVIRWNHIITQKVFSNLTATYTNYTFDIYNTIYDETDNGQKSTIGYKYLSGIRDWTLKEDIDFVPNPNHYIKIGGSITYHTFKPGGTEFKLENAQIDEPDELFNSQDIYATEFDLYAEDDYEITPLFKINVGAHLSGFFVDSKLYTSVQPRFSARYLFNTNLSLKASVCTMTQYVHLLSNSGIGLPTDLWVPATDKVPPQTAFQPALGIAYTIKNMYEISVEAYYKKMNNIIEYKDGTSYLNDGVTDWEQKIESGIGHAYGAEFFIQKKDGRLNGWIGYTLSWSNRQFPTINLGNVFPYKYDIRHDFEIALVYKVNDHIDASATWVIASGQPLSLPVAKYEGMYGSTIYYYEGRNGYRMNPYHRMDVNISFHKEKKYWTRTWNFGAYNIYNHSNPFFVYESYDYQSKQNVYKQITLFPIIPYFSYDFKF